MELRRVCRSASYIVAVTALVLFAYFQDILPPSAMLVPPGAEAAEGLRAHVVSEEEYALARDVDRFSGAHARLFCSRMGPALALAGALCASELFLRDRRGVRAAVYARGASSWGLVARRCVALSAAVFLPVVVMASALSCVAAADYGLFNVDMTAYFRYALAWLLPAILLGVGAGALGAALSGLPLGAAAMALWVWAERCPSAFRYASFLAPRHEALGRTEVFLTGAATLARGRVGAALLGLALMALAALAVERRRGGAPFAKRFSLAARFGKAFQPPRQASQTRGR